MSQLKIFKNAFASIARGGSVAIVMLLSPPFLTRILSKDIYGTWLLILQLSAYVSLLDFGIQTAVGRLVAYYSELDDARHRDSVISTSLALLAALGTIGLIGVLALAWQLPNLFKDMPSYLHQDAQLALLIVGSSLTIALPSSVFTGIFISLQRYDVPAWLIGGSKLFNGFCVILVAHISHNLIWMAITIAIGNIGSGIGLYLAWKKMASQISISLQTISQQTGIEVIEYCYGLLLWNVAILLVSGLDTTIIGIFDYQSLIYYNLAATLINLVIGVQGSISGATVPTVAMMAAQGRKEEIGDLLILMTRYATIVSISISIPLILLSQFITSIWVGSSYSTQMTVLLQMLVLANFIRQFGGPYSMIIILSPLIEGIINLFISTILVSRIGAIGVAIGTMIGAIISVSLHFFYNLPRTKGLYIRSSNKLVHAILAPVLTTIPCWVSLYFSSQIQLSPISSILSILIAIVLMSILLWEFGILPAERKQIWQLIQ
jgi:O-antigen/teichoic acid export membrane protein